MVHRQPLLPVAVAAATGILADARLGHIDGWDKIWYALATLAVVVIFAGRRLGRVVHWDSWDWMRRSATVLVFVPLAGLLHRQQIEGYQSASILAVAGAIDQPVILDGWIDAPPVLRRHPLADQVGRRQQSPWQTQIEMTVDRLKVGRSFQSCDGRVMVVVNGRRDELRPGDAVRLFGAMRRFPTPTNPGERDLRAIYRMRNLHARVDIASDDQIVVIGQATSAKNDLNRLVASVAAVSRDLLLRHTSDRSGPLAVALVIGQRDFVDSDTRDLLLVTGTAHLLSVSGLHLAIVVVLATWTAALLRMPSLVKILWIVAICIVYTAITGGRPPVIRASILVGTLMLAIWVRRPSQPINTLSLAALILLFHNPEFVFSVGVQLSFLAVATLLLCGQRRGSLRAADAAPAVEQTIRREQRLATLVAGSQSIPIRYSKYAAAWLGQLTWYSACVTAISAPLVWFQFHVVSTVSIVTNVLLSPLLFLSLAAGVATVLLGFLTDALAVAPGLVCDLSLRAVRMLIEQAAIVPLGHFWLPAPPAWWVAAFYVAIGLSLMLGGSRIGSLIRYVWIAAWVTVALLMATTKATLEEGTVEATFVDVGHGTAVVLRFAGDNVWLYDCGRLGNDRGSSRDIDVTLWSMGVTQLRGIFLSHADADHFNALPGILKRFGVTQIHAPPGMLDEPEPALAAVRRAVERAGATVAQLSSEACFVQGGHAVTVLHPPRRRLRGSDNANSLVLRIDCGGKSLILPGDLEPPGTDRLIRQRRPPPGGVLMAPHHGSLAMDASSVLQWSRPSETIVSGGQRARRPEVQQMLAVSGSGVHVTSTLGAIRVRVDRRGEIEVRSWKHSPW